MYSASLRPLITLIVTCVVAFTVVYGLMPNAFTTSMQTAEDMQELIARGGKEKTYLELGIESMEAGNPEAAWKYLTAAIEQEPNNPDIYVKRAYVAWNMGNYGQKDADVELALRLNPDHVEALEIKTSGFCADDGIDIEKCFSGVEHMLDLDPDNFEAFFMRAMRYRDMEEADKAIADYTSAIENITEDVSPLTALNVYAGRARLYFDKNMLKEAIADFNAALDAGPEEGPYMLYGYHGEFNRRLSIIDPESANYEALEQLIARLKH